MKLLTVIAAIVNVALIGIIVITTKSGKQTEDFSSPAIAEQWKVTRVLDGDTVDVALGSETRRVRLCGIDAPEKKQSGGMQSRDFLESLISAGADKVAIAFVERDRYGRWIGEVFVSADDDAERFVNEELVTNGHAWPYKQYWNNCPNKAAIAAAEEKATETKKGLWLNPNNIPPWEWRQQLINTNRIN